MVPIDVLFAKDTGIAIPYMTAILNELHKTNKIRLRITTLKQFKMAYRSKKPDLLIYQYLIQRPPQTDTIFPTRPGLDEIFLGCKNKILFDSSDIGSIFTYPHLSPYQPFVIKNCPHKQMYKKHNIVFSSSFWIRRLKQPSVKRTIDVSFRVKPRPNSQWGNLRTNVKKFLRNMERRTTFRFDLEWSKHRTYYPDHLTRVKISVNAPGNGEGTIRHLLTLQAGALMLAHRSIDPIKLLPGADLIAGRDYVSFRNMNDLHDKIKWYLDKEPERNRIAKNGHRKFQLGYKPKRTSGILFKKIQSIMH